jgi:hypothetical protein
VASKAGAFGLLVRFCLALSGAKGTESLMISFGLGLGFIACITTTFGNLAAYTQTNLKRLLAYSTIAHAGYMVMAVAALLVLKNSPQAATLTENINQSIEGLLYYLVVYLFMNLGAFAVIAIARNYTFSEEVDRINPSVSENDDLCLSLLAATWARILSHLRKIFLSPSNKSDRNVVWNHCVCDSAFQIPVTERVIVMWIWLLWSSRTLPAVLKEMLTLTPEKIVPPLEIDKTKEIKERLKLIGELRAEHIISKTEYSRKRQRILDSL